MYKITLTLANCYFLPVFPGQVNKTLHNKDGNYYSTELHIENLKETTSIKVCSYHKAEIFL